MSEHPLDVKTGTLVRPRWSRIASGGIASFVSVVDTPAGFGSVKQDLQVLLAPVVHARLHRTSGSAALTRDTFVLVTACSHMALLHLAPL